MQQPQLITFDTNVSNLSRKVANLTNPKGIQWCQSQKSCRLPRSEYKNSSDVQLLYDTPIALAENLDSLPDQAKHFVYWDYSQPDNLDLLEKNTLNLKKAKGNDVVLISNLKFCDDQYQLDKKNCTYDSCALIIAAIINSYIETGTLPDTNNIRNMLNDRPQEPPGQQTSDRVCDVESLMDYRRNLSTEIDDCVIVNCEKPNS